MESAARLSYAALGDLVDFELPDLPAPQKRALDAALLLLRVHRISEGTPFFALEIARAPTAGGRITGTLESRPPALPAP